jgi:hypothetical protein
MLRFEITDDARGAMPVLDLDDEVIVIGAGLDATLRLPGAAPLQVRIDGHAWFLHAETRINGMVRAAGDSGPLGHAMVIELGALQVRIVPTPAGLPASPARRRLSVARELARSEPPSLVIERGPGVGERRELGQGEALVIGCGAEEAGWVIVDADVARAHCELRRGWDGVTVADLGAKHGTRVDGVRIGEPIELRDGALIGLGRVRLRFRDPAAPARPQVVARGRGRLIAVIAVVLAVVIWLLAR